VYRSPIEKVLYGGYIGKDGTLPVGDLEIGRVINDAGIIRAEDGQYVVSFMSAGEIEQSTEPALFAVIESIRVYQDYLHPRQEIVLGGDSYRIVPNQYNHGLVRYSLVPLFTEPRADAPFVDNPVRRSSTFGTPYLMQGAMVRFWPIDDHWGRIIWDDDEDDVFTYSDWTFGFEDANWNQWNVFTRQDIYVRIDDLLLLGPRHTFPIDYVTDVANPVDKFIIMYVPRRQLTLFEGNVPILKTPIVLNMDATPRGRLYVNRVLMARNMPNYPGVPYTNFLHDGNELNQEGFAIHGAPWHLWNETVTEWETIRRYSHGCINIPNWTVPIGNYELPVDEFIFRWISGFPRPGQDRVHFTTDTVRILSMNNPYSEVFDYSIFDTMRFTNTNWGDILRVWEEKPLDAPERFFINPYNRDNAALLSLDAPTGQNDQTES
ncbi:MAG: L,D-transpeptidase, partial [Burkholderiales bacterium]|nr:L,D-transpeptidase [Anaerolineae bacterium]